MFYSLHCIWLLRELCKLGQYCSLFKSGELRLKGHSASRTPRSKITSLSWTRLDLASDDLPSALWQHFQLGSWSLVKSSLQQCTDHIVSTLEMFPGPVAKLTSHRCASLFGFHRPIEGWDYLAGGPSCIFQTWDSSCCLAYPGVWCSG